MTYWKGYQDLVKRLNGRGTNNGEDKRRKRRRCIIMFGFLRKESLEFMDFLGLKVMKKMKVDEEHLKGEEEDEDEEKDKEEKNLIFFF